MFVDYLQIATEHPSLSVKMGTLKPFGKRGADAITHRAPTQASVDVSPHLCISFHFCGSSSLIWLGIEKIQNETHRPTSPVDLC